MWVLYEPELDSLLVDFGGFVNFGQQVNIVHNQPFHLAPTPDLAQINKLSHHDNHQVRIVDVLMRLGLYPIDKLLELGKVVGD